MVRIALGILGAHKWFGGDFRPVLDLARLADRKGIDQINISEHVVMSEATDKYPYGRFTLPLQFPWFEPITVLASIAGVTEKVRLSTGILIAPLRPAVLLAKQLATLDQISRGRVEVAFGTGWQKEEYDASGIPWDKRLKRLEEQVRVCRLLWSEAPASFHGETVNFDRLYSLPYPAQGRNIPIWFGLAPTERNIARIAELGDGWSPMSQDPEELAPAIAAMKAALAARGRDPSTFQVRTVPKIVFGEGKTVDWDATLAHVPSLVAAGVTVIEMPLLVCRGPDEVEPMIDRLLALKG